MVRGLDRIEEEGGRGASPTPSPEVLSLRAEVFRLAQFRSTELNQQRESQLRRILEEGRLAAPAPSTLKRKTLDEQRLLRLKRLHRRDAIVHVILKGKTFRHLARELGLETPKTAERLVTRWPLERVSTSQLVRIAKVLGVSLDVMFASLKAIRDWGEGSNPYPEGPEGQ